MKFSKVGAPLPYSITGCFTLTFFLFFFLRLDTFIYCPFPRGQALVSHLMDKSFLLCHQPAGARKNVTMKELYPDISVTETLAGQSG